MDTKIRENHKKGIVTLYEPEKVVCKNTGNTTKEKWGLHPVLGNCYDFDEFKGCVW